MDAQIANRLADLRRKAGLSQEALAAKLGVSRQAVSKWERSEASPDTDNLIALASLYSVTLDELLYGKDETSNAEQDETDATENAATAPADDVEQDDPNEDDADADAKAGEHVNIGWNGIHVSKPGEEVHVSWDGIHVDNEAKGEHVHLDRKGLHARDAAGHEVESDGAGGVTVDGTHYASWREAREKLGPDLGSTSPFLRAWNRFPYGVFVAIVVLMLGISTGTWLPALLLLTIPIYHALGRSIGRRSLVPLMKRLISMGLLAWILWTVVSHM